MVHLELLRWLARYGAKEIRSLLTVDLCLAFDPVAIYSSPMEMSFLSGSFLLVVIRD
jgi:hypothetical protein